jgi:hypothetical protein
MSAVVVLFGSMVAILFTLSRAITTTHSGDMISMATPGWP